MNDVQTAPMVEFPKRDFTRIPYRVFTDDSVYQREQEQIFRGPTWNYLGLDAEIANPGDFKSTFVGDIPVVLSRSEDGKAHAFVNRCAHRGAIVCRELRGNAKHHTCVYHQWMYDAEGNLVGAPFRRGISGKGGYPKDFKLEDHGLEKLRVETHAGFIFGTFSETVAALADYLDAPMRENLSRFATGPLRVLGYARQKVAANWKLYADNLRDGYHGTLLHPFLPTFGIFEPKFEGAVEVGNEGKHHILLAKRGKSEDMKHYKGIGSYKPEMALEETGFMGQHPEKTGAGESNITVLTVFPNMVLSQFGNNICARHFLPKGPGHFELTWSFLGYEDDDAEMLDMRLKNVNMQGPAGFVAMEDGEACELVQKGIAGGADEHGYVEMGGREFELNGDLNAEVGIRYFWREYAGIMDFPVASGG